MSSSRPPNRMRRSRWDQKPNVEEPMPSSSNWNRQSGGNQLPVEWNHDCASVVEPVTNSRSNLNTPRPLDYSRQGDKRGEENRNKASEIENNKNKTIENCKDTTKSVPDQRPALLPTPWSFVSNMHHMYPSSSQNTLPYQSPISWNQIPQSYFPNTNYSTGIFDLKWWNAMQAHMGLNIDTNKDSGNFQSGKSGQWSKANKNIDRASNYDSSRRSGRFQNIPYDRNSKLYRDHRQYSQSSSGNSRYNNNNNNNNTNNIQNQLKMWRYNTSNGNRDFSSSSFRPHDLTHAYSWNQNFNHSPHRYHMANFDKKKNISHKPQVGDSQLLKNKSENNNKINVKAPNRVQKTRREKKKNSTAEKAKKKALAVAANKLKMTFLAAKKKPGKKIHKKQKEQIGKNSDSNDEKSDSSTKQKVQDLSIPRSVPKDGTSLEHDIDIKFSASEWETVGRGEGGTRNLVNLPGSERSKDLEDDCDNSDSDSVQSVEEIENRESTDNESDNSETYSDDDETNMEWNSCEQYSAVKSIRRRHVSESCNSKIQSGKCLDFPKSRRVRSYSTSQVENRSPTKSMACTSVSTNLRSMLVKQLLTMDKKSLEELVNNPKSRKAQFMMSHFMKMHRVALSQRLNQLRFQNAPSASTCDSDDLHTITLAQLEILPTDVLEQVKEILAFEESGKAQQMWEEVSLSLSDLVANFEDPNPNVMADEAAAAPSPMEENSDKNENASAENSDDLDCQIVTPPPKLPAAMITIPDSDNEISVEAGSDRKSFCAKTPSSTPSLVESKDRNKSVSSARDPSSSFVKPTITHFRPPHFIRAPSIPQLSPLSHFLPPSHPPIKHSPISTPNSRDPSTSPPHLSILSPPLPSPTPSLFRSPKRLRALSSKNKSIDASSLHHSSRVNHCEMSLPAPSIKVKQERPSPLMECGYCMHPPRSPHTPQCGFAYGIPRSPVSLMPGSPRPLGTTPQRPVPHLAGPSVARVFKQEKQELKPSFVSLNHINRPSSEERPKNPAPPDTTNTEPPSPLPRPPPAPRPIIFSPEGRFPDPPRPASPPPPEHSPRIIKTERQTPQYICCCMRNECERGNGSRPGSDFRRPGTPIHDFRHPGTPSQNQLCENRPATRMYKIEPPFLSRPRSRTPHSGMLGMFSMPLSPRCIGTNNSVVQNTVSNHCLNLSDTHRVSVGVQTEIGCAVRDSRQQSVANITVPRSVTSPVGKTDQMTSTEDLTFEEAIPVPSVISTTFSVCERILEVNDRNPETNIYPESSQTSEREVPQTDNMVDELLLFGEQEREILRRLEAIEKQAQELADERLNLTRCLENISSLLSAKLFTLKRNSLITDDDNCTVNQSTDVEVSTNIYVPVSPNSSTKDIEQETYSDNLYMVTSSEEISTAKRVDSPTESYSNDSEIHNNNIQGERCTSTSLIKNVDNRSVSAHFPKKETDHLSCTDSDDDENKERVHQFQTNNSFTNMKNCFNRQRLESMSTSDEEVDKKELNSVASCTSGDLLEACIKNEIHRDTSSESTGERETVINEFSISHSCNDDNEGESAGHSRKGNLTSSPQSPKMRNSSGSEHGYSLRSRGPPSDLFDFNSDSQSKDATLSSQEDHIDIEVKSLLSEKSCNKALNIDDDQADDELEKDEDSESKHTSSSNKLSGDNLKRRKRKRKSKKVQINKCRKKNDIPEIYRKSVADVKVEAVDPKQEAEERSVHQNFNSDEVLKVPPPHSAAVLDLKVVGHFIFTASSDGTARMFDPLSGCVLATYGNHCDSVTSVQVVGEPNFRPLAPDFHVITGSEDRIIHVYDGKTGILSKSRNISEPVRCFDYRWGYLFIGTDGGCGIKWNLKDKKLGEKVQFCGKGITRLIAHVEGGRRVLVVGAKTTPIMIRDAMSGLFLRTLEYVQLTVYTAIFEGSLLYTGGADRYIYVYDYCSGAVKKTINVGSSVSGLMLLKNRLVATCYDGYIRIFKLPEGELIHCLAVESSHKMFICSSLYKNKILLGNKNGEIVTCQLPDI